VLLWCYPCSQRIRRAALSRHRKNAGNTSFPAEAQPRTCAKRLSPGSSLATVFAVGAAGKKYWLSVLWIFLVFSNDAASALAFSASLGEERRSSLPLVGVTPAARGGVEGMFGPLVVTMGHRRQSTEYERNTRCRLLPHCRSVVASASQHPKILPTTLYAILKKYTGITQRLFTNERAPDHNYLGVRV
jgi:hypothetical protein